MRSFGARYEKGTLNHAKLADKRRRIIMSNAYDQFSREINRASDVVLKLVALIHDTALAKAIKSCLDHLKYHHVCSKPVQIITCAR